MLLGLKAALLLPLTLLVGQMVTPFVEPLPWPAITAASGGWILFGVAMMGLITGKGLATRREVNYLELQIQRKDELIQAFATAATGSAIPALSRSAEVLEAVPATGRTIYSDLRRLEQEIAGLSGKLNEATKDGKEP